MPTYTHTHTPLCSYVLSSGLLTASARGGREIGTPPPDQTRSRDCKFGGSFSVWGTDIFRVGLLLLCCYSLLAMSAVSVRLKFHLARLDSTRLDSTHSTCRAHAFWLCRASRRAQLDSLDTSSSTGSTRRARQALFATYL